MSNHNHHHNRGVVPRMMSSNPSNCIMTRMIVILVILIYPQNGLSESRQNSHHQHPSMAGAVVTSGQCPHPAVPLNAQVSLSSDKSESTYRCDEGYELFGPATRYCDKRTGVWSGELPYCAVNVAYGKPTNQSSTMRGGDSRNANDNDFRTVHEGKYCTESKTESSPWWMVDLLQPYEVKVIRILTRSCCGHSPLHDLEIRVGNSSSVSGGNRLCSWFPGTLDDGQSKDLPCASAIKGRFVFIQMVGVEGSLSLCEVLVFTTKGNVRVMFRR